MDELIIDDKKYLSSKQAAKITGYAKDYVGQLCREGRVEARLVGRSWYVLESSIRDHRFAAEQAEQGVESSESAQEVPTVDAYRESTVEHLTQIEAERASVAHPSVTYISEELATIPELIEKEAVVAEIEAGEAPEASADMQTVWHEWFNTRRSEPETVPQEAGFDQEEAAQQEVEAESIAVHRNYTSHETYAEADSSYSREEAAPEATYEPEAEEEELPRPRRPRSARMPQMSYTLLRAGVVALTILVVGITAIGIGVNEDNRALFGGSSSALDLLSGVYYATK